MIGPLADAVLISFILVMAAAILDTLFGKPKKRPAPLLLLGVLGTFFCLLFIHPETYGTLPGPGRKALAAMGAGALLLYWAGNKSDKTQPSSRRHALSSLAAGALLYLGGVHVPVLDIPLVGQILPNPALSIIFTSVWVFLIVGMIELCSLLPFLAGFVGIFAGAIALLPISSWPSYTGFVLSGVLLGAIPARAIGELIRPGTQGFKRAEILVLAYLVACTTLTNFSKSLTAITLVIPIGIIATVLVVLATSSLDRSLILRAKPRD